MSNSRVCLIRLNCKYETSCWDDRKETFVYPLKVSAIDYGGVFPITLPNGKLGEVETSRILVEGQWIELILGSTREVQEMLLKINME